MIRTKYKCARCGAYQEVFFRAGNAPEEVLCNECGERMMREFNITADTDNISIYNKTTEETRKACDQLLYGTLPSGRSKAAY